MQVRIFFFFQIESNCGLITLLHIFHLPGTTDNADLPVRKRTDLLCRVLRVLCLEETLAAYALPPSLQPLPHDQESETQGRLCSPEGFIFCV